MSIIWKKLRELGWEKIVPRVEDSCLQGFKISPVERFGDVQDVERRSVPYTVASARNQHQMN